MRISIFGLGYVGTVSGACLADAGHRVIGVDKSRDKVDTLNARLSPILEPGLDTVIRRALSKGRLKATVNSEEAILKSDLSLIAVGTYSSADGSADLRAIFAVVEQIGRAIRKKRTHHSVVIRSTVPPGTTRVALARLERASGRRLGKGLGIGMNPEFLREGQALDDFYHPPFIIAGAWDDATITMLRRTYSFLKAPFHRTEPELAEIIKYSCNAYHALKVSFGNEMGRVCAACGIDGLKLMEIFSQDNILNISRKYLKPGVPFGGSCLPKDLRGLASFSKSKGVQVPLLDSILESNESHFAEILKRIEKTGKRKIGVLGITFKEHTDDLRESPLLKLLRCLIDRDYRVMVYDDNIQKRKLVGTNLEILERVVPEYDRVKAETIASMIKGCDLLVITNGQYAGDKSLKRSLRTSKNMVLDLHGGYKGLVAPMKYQGLCW